jgi:hypothetical protein
MTIRTIHLQPVSVVLRKGFEPHTDANGTPKATKHGEPVFIAEAVVPGRIASRYAIDNDRPDTIRVKVAGHDPGHGAGTIVRLSGRVTLTAWYQPRARGADARSDLTITAERVDLAPNDKPAVRGGLEASLPAGLFLGQAADGSVDIMLPPADSYVVEGMAELKCTTTLSPDLIGAEVTAVGLRALYVVPDSEDTSARSKAELVLVCTGLERVGSSNGRARKSDPTPEPAAAEA